MKFSRSVPRRNSEVAIVRLHTMNIIALTQFAFLTLGIVFLKILIQANSDYRVSKYLQTLDRIALWLFAIPIVWIAFAFVCSRMNRAPITPRIAYGVGIVIAALAFCFSPLSRYCHLYDCLG